MNKEKNLTIKECYNLLDEYAAPSVVIKHCESVAKVSYYISKRLIKLGINIDLNKVVYASLLHDILKIVEIDNYTKHMNNGEVDKKINRWNELKSEFKNLNHEEAFYKAFHKNYPTISKIVHKHGYSQIHSGLDSWEEKVLFYADKLVMMDRITTMKERMNEAHKRYSQKYPSTYENNEYVKKTDEKIAFVEKEIFKTTSLTPNELISLNNITFKELIKQDFQGEI